MALAFIWDESLDASGGKFLASVGDKSLASVGDESLDASIGDKSLDSKSFGIVDFGRMRMETTNSIM